MFVKGRSVSTNGFITTPDGSTFESWVLNLELCSKLPPHVPLASGFYNFRFWVVKWIRTSLAKACLVNKLKVGEGMGPSRKDACMHISREEHNQARK